MSIGASDYEFPSTLKKLSNPGLFPLEETLGLPAVPDLVDIGLDFLQIGASPMTTIQKDLLPDGWLLFEVGGNGKAAALLYFLSNLGSFHIRTIEEPLLRRIAGSVDEARVFKNQEV